MELPGGSAGWGSSVSLLGHGVSLWLGNLCRSWVWPKKKKIALDKCIVVWKQGLLKMVLSFLTCYCGLEEPGRPQSCSLDLDLQAFPDQSLSHHSPFYQPHRCPDTFRQIDRHIGWWHYCPVLVVLLHLWHSEVPGPGAKPAPEQQP